MINVKRKTTISIICAALAAYGIIITLFGQFMFSGSGAKKSDIAAALLFVLTAAAFFFAYNKISSHLRPGYTIAVSLIILAAGMLLTPYAPCHDALDLHTILQYMLDGTPLRNYQRTYMNFSINNKLTVFCYYPFVLLMKNVARGVRLANGLFMTGTVVFTAIASYNLGSKKDPGLPMLFISLTAPFLLLCSPYIYAPALFLAAAAIMCFSLKRTLSYIIFVLCTALLFVLRPTCSGFILIFTASEAVISSNNRRELIKKGILFAVTLAGCFVAKASAGTILYKTGAHRYPNMQTAAAVWTLELGTRDQGADTGVCTYNSGTPQADFDEIQNDFHTVWMYYFHDEQYGTNRYDEIVGFQNSVKDKIFKRTLNMMKNPVRLAGHIVKKSVNLYSDNYIPYYVKANINTENISAAADFDRQYFAYETGILLLFFVSMLTMLIRLITKREVNGTAIALGLSAFAVMWVMILFTEVSKKYMFDAFVPMIISVYLILSQAAVTKVRPLTASSIFAVIFITNSIYVKSFEITPLKNAEFSITQTGERTYRADIKLEKPCEQHGYSITVYGGESFDLYGKDSFSAEYPKHCADVFTVTTPAGYTKTFSAQEL